MGKAIIVVMYYVMQCILHKGKHYVPDDDNTGIVTADDISQDVIDRLEKNHYLKKKVIYEMPEDESVDGMEKVISKALKEAQSQRNKDIKEVAKARGNGFDGLAERKEKASLKGYKDRMLFVDSVKELMDSIIKGGEVLKQLQDKAKIEADEAVKAIGAAKKAVGIAEKLRALANKAEDAAKKKATEDTKSAFLKADEAAKTAEDLMKKAKTEAVEAKIAADLANDAAEKAGQ